MPFPFVDDLLAALGGGDDPDLWRLVADTFAAGLEGRIELRMNPPRHLVVGFARVPRRTREAHPEEHATLRMHWGRERGVEAWEALGPHPRLRRKRGHYVAIVCVPGGSRRLAVAKVNRSPTPFTRILSPQRVMGASQVQSRAYRKLSRLRLCYSRL